jgi:hypothetical protein
MKKIIQKIFQSKSSISNWLLFLLMYLMFAEFSVILDQTRTIKEQRFMRICPEPYVCIVPPENWKGKVPMGLTYYKRIPV